MRKTKTLAMFLIFMLLITLLAGCGQQTSEPEIEQKQQNNPELEQKTEPGSKVETGPFSYNPELEGTMKFCIKENINDNTAKLVAVTQDGKEIVIIQNAHSMAVNGISTNIILRSFDWYRNRLYLGAHEGLAYIELDKGNGNYEIKLLTTSVDVGLSRIIATPDTIYIVGAANDGKYSLINGTYARYSGLQGDTEALKYDAVGNNLVKWDANDDLILVNCATGAEAIIDTDIMFPLVYNGKIIYRKTLDDKVSPSFIYYEYNIISKKTAQISDVLTGSMGASDYIFPYGDSGYMFLDNILYGEETIWRISLYKDGKNEIIAELNCYTSIYVFLLSKDKIGIISGNGMDDDRGDVLNKTMDLNTKAVTNANLDFVYIDNVWTNGFSS